MKQEFYFENLRGTIHIGDSYIHRVKQKVSPRFLNVVTVLPVTEIGGGKQ